ncbi:MAG: sulfotransferase [Actinomycetota bacterium]|nr:sulfotransferase [Actinomycetota bacterium]
MAQGADSQASGSPRAADLPLEAAPIVFVGGTGRSGTHVVARLLGRSEHLALIPVECRFHTDADGFPGLLAGEATKDQFLRRMRGFWWRGFQTNRIRGLHRVVPRDRFDAALRDFESGFDADPKPACRKLLIDLLAPQAEEWPRQGIVEQSCDVIAQAPILAELFPEARFVHIVRDGRDASASRVAQTRGLVYPRTRKQGIEWWETRIRAIDAGARAIPDGRLQETELGRLFGRSRMGTLRRLSRHVGIKPERSMRRFVKTRMSPERANAERWRQGISRELQAELERLYQEALERLERDQVSCAPLLRRAYER